MLLWDYNGWNAQVITFSIIRKIYLYSARRNLHTSQSFSFLKCSCFFHNLSNWVSCQSDGLGACTLNHSRFPNWETELGWVPCLSSCGLWENMQVMISCLLQNDQVIQMGRLHPADIQRWLQARVWSVCNLPCLQALLDVTLMGDKEWERTCSSCQEEKFYATLGYRGHCLSCCAVNFELWNFGKLAFAFPPTSIKCIPACHIS